MTLDQAHRILNEPRYLRQVIELTIAEMGRNLLGPSGRNGDGPPPTLEHMQAVAEGMRIVEGLLTEAETIIRAAAGEAADAAEPTDLPPIPPAMAAALTVPVKESSGS